MKGTGRKRPRYSCPDLKDDVVEELIDRCDVITLASMQVRSRPFSTQLITSLQGTQESGSGLISPIFFAVTLMTGAITTEVRPMQVDAA